MGGVEGLGGLGKQDRDEKREATAIPRVKIHCCLTLQRRAAVVALMMSGSDFGGWRYQTASHEAKRAQVYPCTGRLKIRFW